MAKKKSRQSRQPEPNQGGFQQETGGTTAPPREPPKVAPATPHANGSENPKNRSPRKKKKRKRSKRVGNTPEHSEAEVETSENEQPETIRWRTDLKHFNKGDLTFDPMDKSGLAIHRYLVAFERKFAAQLFGPGHRVLCLTNVLGENELVAATIAKLQHQHQATLTWAQLTQGLRKAFGSKNATQAQRQVVKNLAQGRSEGIRAYAMRCETEVALANTVAHSEGSTASNITPGDLRDAFVEGLSNANGTTHNGMRNTTTLHISADAGFTAAVEKAIHIEETEEKELARQHQEDDEDAAAAAPAALSQAKQPTEEVITTLKKRKTVFTTGGRDKLSKRNRGQDREASESDSEEEEGQALAATVAAAVTRALDERNQAHAAAMPAMRAQPYSEGPRGNRPPSNARNTAQSNVCFKFANTGSCHYGTNCRFEHGPTGGNRTSAANSAPLGNANNRNREPCRNFARGLCNRGSSCRYDHSAQPQGQGGATRPYNTSAARPYNTSATRPNNTSSQIACKDYQKGACTRGQGCRFAHI